MFKIEKKKKKIKTRGKKGVWEKWVCWGGIDHEFIDP